jgi:hypothetical protein
MAGGNHPQDHMLFPKRFRRTDSQDSNASSMASSFGLASFLSRSNSRAKGLMRGGSGMLAPHLAREAAQAAAYQRSVEAREQQKAVEEAAAAASRQAVPGEVAAAASTLVPAEALKKAEEEVTVVVSGGRKNSITKAVR